MQHVEFTSIHVVWVNWKEWVYFLLQLIGVYFNEKDSLLPVQDRMNPLEITPQIAKFMGPTWGPPGSCRPQMGPMLAPWTLLSGTVARSSNLHNGISYTNETASLYWTWPLICWPILGQYQFTMLNKICFLSSEIMQVNENFPHEDNSSYMLYTNG